MYPPPARRGAAGPSGISSQSGSDPVRLPPGLVAKCIVPYARHLAPSLNGHPIVVGDRTDADTASDNTIRLFPVLMDLAQRVLKAEMDRPADKHTLRVTALCTPQLDSHIASDAAVRHLAHHFKYDMVILDAEDLANGENGAFGTEFCRVLWSLYTLHYELKTETDALAPLERALSEAAENLAHWNGIIRFKTESTVEPPQVDLQFADASILDEDSGFPSNDPSFSSDEAREGSLLEEGSVDSVTRYAIASGVSLGEPATDRTPAFHSDDDSKDGLSTADVKPAYSLLPEPSILNDEHGLSDLQSARDRYEACAEALSALKAQHAARSGTRAVHYATALSWLRAFLRAGGSPYRKRILYLRNYAASSAVFAPLIAPLLDASSTLKHAPVVVAGIGRAQLLRSVDGDAAELDKLDTTKHEAFLRSFDTNAALLDYVRSKYSADWRQADTSDGRASSIGDLFFRAVMARRARGQLRLRGHREALQLDSDSRCEIVAALAVGVEDESVVSSAPQEEALARRVLACHVPRLHAALTGEPYNREWLATPSEIVDQWMALLRSSESDEASHSSASKLTEVLHTSTHIVSLAARLSAWLPAWESHQPIKTADVFAALARSDAALAELQPLLAVARAGPQQQNPKTSTAPSAAERVRNATDLDEYEKRLLGAIVDPATISTTYDDVCMQPEIIETLRSVVSLPLLYADAYSTGILGRESMAGVLLYGPPGTGNMMLCRALAKESGANMLQIQASTIRSTWHSEDEKLIHAAFTLARRLGPCVIFIDEIDALFGSRAHAGQTHRATLTEFLQEMDGLKTAAANKASKVVVVGATNRPQDLDDAVLRRLPRRVLVDLPGSAEREKILRHYLTGEQVDETVDVAALAERTAEYSGSDLKHLVFSAALAAFKDTIPDLWNAAERARDTRPPPQRVIGARHFEQALREIAASASTHSDSVAELRGWGGSAGEA